MKHNNLKKPAAVLTALALAAALLAGCGAASDSMAASSAPAESEAVSTETPAESADEGDADEVAAKKCADLIDAIYGRSAPMTPTPSAKLPSRHGTP